MFQKEQRSIFENVPLGIFRSTVEGRLVEANPALARMFGYDSVENMMEELRDISKEFYVSPDERSNLVREVFAFGGVAKSEVRRRRRDGSIMIARLYMRAVRDNASGQAILEGFLEDITVQKQTEDALKASEERFRLMFENHGAVMLLIDPETGAIIDANPAATAFYGYPHDQLCAMKIFDINPQEKSELGENLSSAASGENGYFVSQNRLADGEFRTVEVYSYPFVLSEREILFSIIHDISERRKADEMLTRANAFNSLLMEAMPFGIGIVDIDGKILFSSEKLKELIGSYSEGRHCWEAYSDDKRRCEGCPLPTGMKPGETTTVETAGVFGGKAFRITHSAITYEGREAVLETFQDITENRQLQSQLAQAQKLESIGTLASGIAHDFNNLLGIIIGNAALIRKSSQDGENFLKRVGTIVEAAERGTALVKQMLAFGRKAEPVYMPVSINRAVGEILKLLHETFPRSVRLLANLTEGIPMVNADPTQLHQVLLNLCVNARDAMKYSGDLILTTEVVSAETVHRLFPSASAPEYVLVGISDNGVGMEREVLEHIFEPFFTTKEPGKGTGLGLSVVYGIMQEHHGFVSVTSEPGKGTAFSLYFPVLTHCIHPAVEEDASGDDTEGGAETILLVEDEEMLNELLASILSSKGYGVMRASDGKEAVEVYRKNKESIALVISDFGLPKLTGGEVLPWLKEINPEVKFILATGYIDPAEREAVIENGAKEIVMKPYRPADILKKVRRVLDLH